MKICMLTSGHDPFDGRVFYRGALSLIKHYNEVIIVAPYEKDTDEREGVKIIGFRRRKTDSILSRFRPLIELYRRACNIEADVYHCHEPDSLLVGWMLKKRYKGKLIFDCHEYHPEQFATRYPSIIARLFELSMGKTINYLASKCDYVIMATEGISKLFDMGRVKVVTLPNYPLSKMITANAIHNRKRKRGEILRGVWVGTINPRRGLFELIEALEILIKDNILAEVLIIGDGERPTIKKLVDMIRQKGLDNLISVPGYVEYALLWKQVSNANFGILLDYPIEINLNTVANKLYEYMGVGLPVLASDLPGFRQVIDVEKCGVLVNPHNPKNIAEGIKYLIENPDTIRLMGENGRKAFLDKYSWESVEKKLFETYKALEAKHV